MATELVERLEKILGFDIEDRHSLFQLKHFVLGKETTVQGQLWQCIREIRARRNAIVAATDEEANSRDQLSLMNIQHRELDRQLDLCKAIGFEKSEDPLTSRINEARYEDNVETLEIQIRQCVRKIESQERHIHSLNRKIHGLEVEATFLAEEFDRLNDANPIKPLDDVDSQKEYWTARLFQEVHLKSLLGQPLDTELVKTVLAMNDESPVKAQMVSFLNAIKDSKAQGNVTKLTK